ncbi:hypothetical protein GTA08_BOTSDO09897 [Botryosphaeria dothidea]|uniref:Metallo-beta-lactamase domain-containing protein n=1 Tax=Botryosphaeria dothidea TaxID=55169 RepID=A0A8H4INU6_9PEZI|nr:hypothetical protein GTA08_BOTSDO09897 [Botryosphaeria dothidea]
MARLRRLRRLTLRQEFPAIRIDFFRASTHHPPPLAGFLSHVHSDHLQGLESLKAPFVYCSPATREILLRLEKHPHRMNFAKGILESRIQTNKHLKKLLKTIPLEAPTVIELSPGNEIQVTLFDANHCIGAVMFLIQGGGNAILYTSDVRAETWWVSSLMQNPLLLPFASGHTYLDKMYLDTTYANRSEINRKFPSKAEGLRELLGKVSNYPKNTIFHFEAWTFGYENDGTEIAEAGIGGGKGDMDQIHELETNDPTAVDQLMQLCASRLNRSETLSELLRTLRAVKESGQGRIRLCSSRDMALLLDDAADGLEDEGLPLQRFVEMLARHASDASAAAAQTGKTQRVSSLPSGAANDNNNYAPAPDGTADQEQRQDPRPRIVTFPWARHASYAELCELVSAFRLRDVHPCTVDEANWTPDDSMRALFGQFCSGDVFAHDEEMMKTWERHLVDASDAILPTPLPASSSAARTTGSYGGEVDEAAPASLSIREWAAKAARNSQDLSWADFGGLICTGNGHTEEELEL